MSDNASPAVSVPRENPPESQAEILLRVVAEMGWPTGPTPPELRAAAAEVAALRTECLRLREDARPPDTAYVLMTNELISDLSSGEWSPPVRVRIESAEGLKVSLVVERYDDSGLREDAARLDWLGAEDHVNDLTKHGGGIFMVYSRMEAGRAVFTHHTSLRDAIDAARSSRPENPTNG